MFCCLTVVAFSLSFLRCAEAAIIGGPLSLDQLTKDSDLVVKATALGSVRISDPAFPAFSGNYPIMGTRFRVISVFKGDETLKEFTFHHFGIGQSNSDTVAPEPQMYEFEDGRNYILFAKKTADPLVFLTFEFGWNLLSDQGVVHAATANPLPKGTTPKAAVWSELTGMLQGTNSEVVYAIKHLDIYSNPQWQGLAGPGSFPRGDVLQIISPLLPGSDQSIVSSALEAVGSGTPYWSDGSAERILNTVRTGVKFPGVEFGPGYVSPAACCRQPLLALANGTTTISKNNQAKAIRSLGRTRLNEQDTVLLEPLRKWSRDPDPGVRAAAAFLWIDFPSEESIATLRLLASDDSPAVKTAVAYSIGISKSATLVDVLERLLSEGNGDTHKAAALSLVCMDVQLTGPILKKHLADRGYGVAFLNALGAADPATYRDQLTEVIKLDYNQIPGSILSGEIPSYTAWKTLLTYIRKNDVNDIRTGKLDKYLDALESPPNIGSEPYQTLYRYYAELGLAPRMEAFREKVLRQHPNFDIYLH